MPEVMDRLRALGHDVSRLRSKSWNEFTGPTRRAWISSSRSATRRRGRSAPTSARRRSPPPGRCRTRPNSRGSAVERATLLNELYASLRRRIEIFTSLPFASLDRMALKARLDEIGDSSPHRAVREH